jgi:CheY-like chemotaxis protein
MAERRRILIVDDSMTVCSLIEKILRSCDFAEIEAVQHGQAALDRLQATHFDIVICDCEMAPIVASKSSPNCASRRISRTRISF